MPWAWLRAPGSALGWLAGSVLRVRRGAVEEAMGRAGIDGPPREARAMYAALGASALELFWLAGATPAARDRVLDARVVLDDALKAALAKGRVVIAASHTANWELVAYGAARFLEGHGRRLAVVVKPLSVGAFHAFCMRLREACRLDLVAPEGALRAARRALARGDVVAMPIDQVPDLERHGLRVPFLGAPALADRAPAALARASGAPLIVVGARREGAAITVHLVEEIAPGRDTEAATRAATLALSRFVLAAPSSWLWLHRRWRLPRAALDAARQMRDRSRRAAV
ncbi:MAG: lysophospholipid acyltransferase family protein [Labilithrix sp.]|nr:lysophospholipid acyltransferase family protein [Labilithrix sp.]